jgi:hypothetical protein
MSQNEAVRTLCNALGLHEGPDLELACERVMSGWRIHRVVSDPMQHIGLRPWVVSDKGAVATIPFGSSATDVLRQLDSAGH